jgi:hypothetical protein
MILRLEEWYVRFLFRLAEVIADPVPFFACNALWDEE